MEESICRNCKYWNLHYGHAMKNPKNGICTNKVVIDMVKKSMFITDPTFGCNQYKNK